MGLIWDEESGRLRRTHALIITLCCSRHMYVYLTFSQDIRAVIEGFEAAWGYFEGITIIVIIDNLKPAIDKSDRYNPKINRQFLEYAQSRGFIVKQGLYRRSCKFKSSEGKTNYRTSRSLRKG